MGRLPSHAGDASLSAIFDKLIIQIPCLNEAETLPIALGRPAARGGRLPQGRMAGH